MRKYLLILGAALLLTACTTASALTVSKASVSAGAAVDSLSIRVPFTLPTGADSARITLTLTPGGAQTVTVNAPAVAYVFRVPRPAPGVGFTFRACGTPYAGLKAGTSSCNTAQQYTTPPGAITWPDTMTIAGMAFPDSSSLALMAAAEADALSAADSGLVWLQWGQALWVRGERDTRAWQEVRVQALAFAKHPKHRQWWDDTRACGGCAVYLPFTPIS